MLTGGQLALLADFIVVSRRDYDYPWDRAGVLAALREVDPSIPWYRIALAAIKAAGDPRIETPGILNLDGAHWERGFPVCHEHPQAGTRTNGECAGCWADSSKPTPFQRTGQHGPPPHIKAEIDALFGGLRG